MVFDELGAVKCEVEPFLNEDMSFLMKVYHFGK